MRSSVDIKNIAIVALIVAWALTLGIFGLIESSAQRDKEHLHNTIDEASKALVMQKKVADDFNTQIEELTTALAASEAKSADLERSLEEANQNNKTKTREFTDLASRAQTLSKELTIQKNLVTDYNRQLAISNREIERLTNAVEILKDQLKKVQEPAPDFEQ